MTKQTRFYTVEQIAEKLQLHWQTVLDLIKSGELEAFKIGRGYRILPDSLEQFIDERKIWSIESLASLEEFSSKPKKGEHSRYRSILILPLSKKERMIPSTAENDRIIKDICNSNFPMLDPKSDVDGVIDKRELKLSISEEREEKAWEIYFRANESGVIFFRESLREPKGEVYIGRNLYIIFRILKLAHDLYKKFSYDGPVLIKFRMEDVENDILKTGSFRRSTLSVEDRAIKPKIEINKGPVKLEKEKVADLTVEIAMQINRGFGNNRITPDVLKDFLQNIIEGKE